MKSVIKCVLLLGTTIHLFSQQLLWEWEYNGAGNGSDLAECIAYGDSKLFLGGNSIEHTNSLPRDFIVCAIYSNTGSTAWIYLKNGSYNGNDRCRDIAYYNGYVYATGELRENDGYRWYITKLNSSNGSPVWEYIRPSADPEPAEEGKSIDVGDDGYIYSGGQVDLDPGPTVFGVIKTDPSTGQEVWEYIREGDSNGSSCNVVIFGNDLKVYAGGYAEGTYSGDNFIVVRLDPSDGNELWTFAYNYANEDDECEVLIYGSDGGLYAGGYCEDSNGDDQFFVVRLNRFNGNYEWMYFYTPKSECHDLCLGNDGYLYAVGHANYKGLLVKINPSNGNVLEQWEFSTVSGFTSIEYGDDDFLYISGPSPNGVKIFKIDPYTMSIEWIYSDSLSNVSWLHYRNSSSLFGGGYGGTNINIRAISIDPSVGIKEHLDHRNTPLLPTRSILFLNASQAIKFFKKHQIYDFIVVDITGRNAKTLTSGAGAKILKNFAFPSSKNIKILVLR